jgi:hypothetical protein
MNDKDTEKLREYINKLIDYIPIHTHNEEEYFRIILYCMWWTANNYSGILEYYQGIHEVFSLINEYLPEEQEKYFIYPEFDFSNINILDEEEIKEKIKVDNKFEKNILILSKKPFIIYNQESSNSFCNNRQYSDCGETTCRNLINLICYNGNKFDIKELSKYKPLAELIQYYETFKNFNEQSDVNTLKDIYGKKLNARDAWSYLIIKCAYDEVLFLRSCDTDVKINFELNAGLAEDNKTSNFFQLIKNLLGIEKWDNINGKYIETIEDYTKKGIGEIHIQHKRFKLIKIQCEEQHYFMEPIKIEKEKLDLSGINQEKKDMIDILLKKKEKIDI